MTGSDKNFVPKDPKLVSLDVSCIEISQNESKTVATIGALWVIVVLVIIVIVVVI